MTKNDSKLDIIQCEITYETDLLKPNTPFEWTVHIRNTGQSTFHISYNIRSYNVIDEKTLEVSTEVPQLAKEVNLALQPIPETVPVDSGQTIDQKFQITLPLRIGRFVGIPPRVEVNEWMPQGELKLQMNLAYGKHPFYLPSDPGQLNDELRKWTNLTVIPPLKLKI